MTQENKGGEPQTKKNPQEIEAAIDDTRSALTDDIKALSNKASPAHVKHEVKQAVKEAKDNIIDKVVDKGTEVKDAVVDRALEIKDVATEKAAATKEVALQKAHEAGEAVSEAVDEVATRTREMSSVAWRFTITNAVPLGLIGVGAGWLISNQRGSRRMPAAPYATRDELDLPNEDFADLGDYPADNLAFASDANYPTRGRAAIAGRRIGNGRIRQMSQTSHAKTKLRQSAKHAYEQAGEGLEHAQHKLSESAARGRDVVQETWERVQHRSRELADANPLALAFGTLIAGIGVGLLLPSSSREDRLLQPARDRIRRTIGSAQELAQDVGHMAQQTAQESVAHATGNYNMR